MNLLGGGGGGAKVLAFGGYTPPPFGVGFPRHPHRVRGYRSQLGFTNPPVLSVRVGPRPVGLPGGSGERTGAIRSELAAHCENTVVARFG